MIDNKKPMDVNKSLFVSNLSKQKEDYEVWIETMIAKFIEDAENSGDIVWFVYSNQFLVETLVQEWLFDSVKEPIISDAVYQILVSFIKYAILLGLIWLVLFLIKLYISYLIFNQIKYRKLFNYPLKNSFIRKQFWIKDETDYEMYNLFVEMFSLSDFIINKGYFWFFSNARLSFNWNDIIILKNLKFNCDKTYIEDFDYKVVNLDKSLYPKYLKNLLEEKINNDFEKLQVLEKLKKKKNKDIKKNIKKIKELENKIQFVELIKPNRTPVIESIKYNIKNNKDLDNLFDEYNKITNKIKIEYSFRQK